MQLGPVRTTQLVGENLSQNKMSKVWLNILYADLWGSKLQIANMIRRGIIWGVTSKWRHLWNNLCVSTCFFHENKPMGQQMLHRSEGRLVPWNKYEVVTSTQILSLKLKSYAVRSIFFLVLGFLLCLHRQIAGDEAISNKKTEQKTVMQWFK